MCERGIAGAEWSRLVEGLADDLQDALWIRHYGDHVDRVRSLSTPSEKLVYFFLVESEPQSFTTVRCSLSLSSRTVDKALRRLLARGYVFLEEKYLYWVAPPESDWQP